MTGRVLYVIDSLAIGGAEMLLLDLVDAAAARGWDRHVAYFTPGALARDLTARGVPLTRLSTAGLRGPSALFNAHRLIRRFKPDVVHTHLTKSDLIGQPAAWAAGVRRRISSLHNTNPWRQRPVLSRIYRLATGGVQARIAVSEVVANWAVASASVPRSGLTVIRNGVDTVRFDPAKVRPLDLGRWGVPPGAVTVAVIGRLTAQKDHGNFLAAAASLATRRQDVHFLIVGAGPLEAAIRSRVAELGLLPDRLTLTGEIREVPALLAAIDVVAFSSAWEGLPMVLLEAMAMARPVVSTAVGAVPEVVSDGTDGILVPPREPAALAAALERFLADGALRAAAGAKARTKVAGSFDARAMHDRIFTLYAEGGGAA